jgi:hypothetical protein
MCALTSLVETRMPSKKAQRSYRVSHPNPLIKIRLQTKRRPAMVWTFCGGAAPSAARACPSNVRRVGSTLPTSPSGHQSHCRCLLWADEIRVANTPARMTGCGTHSPFAAVHKFSSYRALFCRVFAVTRPVGVDPDRKSRPWLKARAPEADGQLAHNRRAFIAQPTLWLLERPRLLAAPSLKRRRAMTVCMLASIIDADAVFKPSV